MEILEENVLLQQGSYASAGTPDDNEENNFNQDIIATSSISSLSTSSAKKARYEIHDTMATCLINC